MLMKLQNFNPASSQMRSTFMVASSINIHIAFMRYCSAFSLLSRGVLFNHFNFESGAPWFAIAG
jgi:hypothetical protein